MTDLRGTPLAVLVSSASRHDVNFMLPLVFCSFPRVGGIPGRPPETPKVVRADAGYTSQNLLSILAWCGIRAELPNVAKRTQPVLANSAGRSNEQSPGSNSTAESASAENATSPPFRPSYLSLAHSSPINNSSGNGSEHMF